MGVGENIDTCVHIRVVNQKAKHNIFDIKISLSMF